MNRLRVSQGVVLALAGIFCAHTLLNHQHAPVKWLPLLAVMLVLSLIGLALALGRLIIEASERRRLEEESLQYALFPLYNPFPLMRFSSDGTIIMANPAAVEVFDISLAKPIPLQSLLTDLEPTELQELIDKGLTLSREYQIGGKHFKFTILGLPTLGFGQAYGTDISDLKNTQESLRNSEQFLRTVIDTDPNLIFVKDQHRRFTLVNEAVAKIYGSTTSALIGKRDEDFNQRSDEVQWFQSDDQKVIEQHRDVFIPQERITDAQGGEHWLQTHKRPIKLPHTDQTHILGVATDITENKLLQSQLLQSQKMEAVGLLAGGIAHDFNNLLTGVFGYTSLLKLNHGDNPDILAISQSIEGAATRASELTQKLLGFARKGKYQNTPVDIHSTINETLQLLGRTIEKNIHIVQRLTAVRTRVLGDPLQLQQMILNLVINARDAMSLDVGGSDGGELTIETRDLPFEEALPLNERNSRTGDYLRISIKDTGCGIPAEIKDKIFEPFFTTKDPNRGTGMGLAMVYGIAKSHCGLINVQSERGAGSTFEIYLPLIENGLSAEVEKTACVKSDLLKHQRGKILLVEDHNVTREATSSMLQAVGYQVITASDGVEAVECYKDRHSDIDLIIVDMVMPRMGARDCFREIRKINPGARVILSTGYANSHQVQEIVAEGMSGFMQKPFKIEQLYNVVGGALRQLGRL